MLPTVSPAMRPVVPQTFAPSRLAVTPPAHPKAPAVPAAKPPAVKFGFDPGTVLLILMGICLTGSVGAAGMAFAEIYKLDKKEKAELKRVQTEYGQLDPRDLDVRLTMLRKYKVADMAALRHWSLIEVLKLDIPRVDKEQWAMEMRHDVSETLRQFADQAVKDLSKPSDK